MTLEELKDLEATIAASFIRSNVLSIQEASDHASLAVAHVRNALKAKSLANQDVCRLLESEAA